MGPVYRASFRVQRGNGIGSFFRGLFRFVKPLYSGAKAIGKEALKTGSNIITDMLNKEPNSLYAIFLKIDLLRQKITSNKKLKK